MADFEKVFKNALRHEGGYVFHPADPGGETNMGITDRLDGKVDGLIDVDGDGDGDVPVKKLTEPEARVVYRRMFWTPMWGDQLLDQSIADIIFDGFLNCGPRGLKIIQRIIGVKDDGVFGPVTVTQVNVNNPRELFEKIKQARIADYHNLVERKPHLGVFLKGWLNRINGFTYSK